MDTPAINAINQSIIAVPVGNRHGRSCNQYHESINQCIRQQTWTLLQSILGTINQSIIALLILFLCGRGFDNSCRTQTLPNFNTKSPKEDGK
jgi:hypothetical protein